MAATDIEDPPTGERLESEPDPAPESDPEEILECFRARLRGSQTHFSDWREEARTLYEMEAGRPWDPEDEAVLREQGRPKVTFNVAGKYMDAVQGLQINNRQDIKFAAREPGKIRVNEQLTGAVAWGRDLTAMADDETDAFRDCILTGMGFMEGYMDHDLEAGGVPGGARVDPLECFPDPVAHKRNFEDGRFMIRLKWYATDEYKTIIEEMGGQSADAPDASIAIDSEDDDGPLSIIEQPQDYKDTAGGSAPAAGSNRRRAIADYQWWAREKSFEVEAKGLGKQTFDETQWAVIEPRLKAQKITHTVQPSRRKVYYRAFIAGSTVLKHGKSPYQGGFTIHAITGKRDRNTRTWYGIGRAILDPQKWVNKFFSTILYAMMTNAKGGIMAEENTFTDPRKAEQDWANPASITWVKPGALTQGKVEPKPPAQYPQGLDRLMTFSLDALPQTSGLNLEIMGMADRMQAGVLEAQRKQSAMAIIAWAFDAMRRYYRSMGRMLATFVRDYVPEGTLVLIAGEAGKQYVPLVKQNLKMEVDVIVDEAPTSVNQQERVWGVLQAIIPQLLQAGMQIPPQVLDYVPLPQDLVEAWKEAVKPDPQTQQIKQKELLETLQQMMADTQEKAATAALKRAQAAQIQQEMRQPENDPNAQLSLEAMKAKIDAAVETHIAAFKADKQAETQRLIQQMNIDSQERIAQMNAMIDAKLEAMRIAADSDSKVTVAAIAAGKKPLRRQKAEAKKSDDFQSTVTKHITNLNKAVAELKKPRKHTIVRDPAGEISQVITE